ncbi:DUF6489 family protein [uncultured Abyssibacter sp.]|uniref:DUF6489 family protein n=1 Tax=uncultured Abyssibacter sp. TaxID=2320202 RepID=UPI0032B1E505
MIIKIEIDVKPEELRSFLGLPDVVGIQEDIIKYVRDRMSSAEGFDPTTFVRENVERGGRAWQRVLATAFARAADDIDPETDPEPPRRRTRRKSSKKPDSDA